MFNSILNYFAQRHILSNFLFISVFLGGWFCLDQMGREEMPDFVSDRVRISISYPGATASEVEHFVIRPMEEVLRGVEDIYQVQSTASYGSASINISIEGEKGEFKERVEDIRAAISDVKLPEEITELPNIRVFQSSKKAIIDIALYDSEAHVLSPEQRAKLQKIAIRLEEELLQLPQVNSVNRNGFLKEQLRIEADPIKLKNYRLSLNSLGNTITAKHQRKPAGNLKDSKESRLTLSDELDTPDKLENLIIDGGFTGPLIRLKDVAQVKSGFEDEISIQKVNGHEAVILNVVKTSKSGILRAVDHTKQKVQDFSNQYLNNHSVKIQLLDDESLGVRNRLELVTSNGILGLVLIIVFLFIFLSITSGIWVALGIPFCFAFTAICAYMMGYTINNMTLAAVILVMGMIVDDAIVVAENIQRLKAEGLSAKEAAIQGAQFVSKPILAAILTTCGAFVPMLFFDDRFGQLIKVIPVIVILMLIASLIESLLILPGHMSLGRQKKAKAHWFSKVEDLYGKMLEKTLWTRWVWFLGFGLILWYGADLYQNQLKFVLFPNEESTQFRINLEAPKDTKRLEMANLTRRVENLLMEKHGQELIGVRSQIARSRHGRPAQENVASLRVEVVPKQEREIELKKLLSIWKAQIDTIPGFTKVRMSTARWGQEDGDAIEIQILENNDSIRKQVSNYLVKEMNSYSELMDSEADRPLNYPEYLVKPKDERLRRLSISPSAIGQLFRTLLQGTNLYELIGEYDDIQVVLTVSDKLKSKLSSLLEVPIENKQGYLIPLKEIIQIKQGTTPSSIERLYSKRLTTVYAAIKPVSEQTPIEIAEYLEEKVFPKIKYQYESVQLRFGGEVEDSRNSQGNLKFALIGVFALIYMILTLMFNNLFKPLIILSIIPFAVAGVVFTFVAHGINQYGLFAVIGVLGLIGVIVNDTIILVVKLDEVKANAKPEDSIFKVVSMGAKTRLRAVLLTTMTTVAGLFPTAYGVAGYDGMLAEMMLALAWGLVFGTILTLGLVPALYVTMWQVSKLFKKKVSSLFIYLPLFLLTLPSPNYAQTDSLSVNWKILSERVLQLDPKVQNFSLDSLDFDYLAASELPSSDWVASANSEIGLNLKGELQPSSQVSINKEMVESGTFGGVKASTSNNSSQQNWSADAIYGVDLNRNKKGGQVGLIKDRILFQKIITRNQIQESIESYLLAQGELYLDWVQSGLKVASQELALQEAITFLKHIENKKRNYIAYKVDVDKAKLQQTNRELALQSAKGEKNIKEALLRQIIKSHKPLVLQKENWRYPIEPTFNLPKIPDDSDSIEKWFKILPVRNRSLYQNQIKVTQKELALKEEQGKSIFRLYGGAGIQGPASDWRESPRLVLGLSWSNTLGRSQLKAQKAIVRNDLIRLKARLIQNIREWHRSLEQIKLQYETIQAKHKTLIKQLEISTEILKEENREYIFGRININDLLQAQNSVQSAQLEINTLEVQLERYKLRWLESLDLLY